MWSRSSLKDFGLLALPQLSRSAEQTVVMAVILTVVFHHCLQAVANVWGLSGTPLSQWHWYCLASDLQPIVFALFTNLHVAALLDNDIALHALLDVTNSANAQMQPSVFHP